MKLDVDQTKTNLSIYEATMGITSPLPEVLKTEYVFTKPSCFLRVRGPENMINAMFFQVSGVRGPENLVNTLFKCKDFPRLMPFNLDPQGFDDPC